MSDIAIRVENLGKQYRIGAKQERYNRFTEQVMDSITAPIRRLRNLGQPPSEDDTIWALKDVSFEVQRGEVVGIIGRNGAGKSTLLKILSRITEPTTGRVELHGRVGSLLEVGTGFHPELTGRENVYLNGAILGMRREEIDRKFDEIVDFSGVEKFLDTPVKRYSSGMQVRLAFAVAAHLEPEILLVDEVLAVGDAEFQKKCLGKMGEVARGGRTVLFVSHNMTAVSNLCPRAMHIADGKVLSTGRSGKVIADYLSMTEAAGGQLDSRVDRRGDGTVRFASISVLKEAGESADTVASGDDVTFALDYRSRGGIRVHSLKVNLTVDDALGERLAVFSSDTSGADLSAAPPEGRLLCTVPHIPFTPGRYRVTVYCEANGAVADWIKDAFILQVVGGDFYGTGALPTGYRARLYVSHTWRLDGDSD